MKKKKIQQKKIAYFIGLIGIAGIIGTILWFWGSINKKEEASPYNYAEQEVTLKEDNHYPIEHIGLDKHFWKYTIVDVETSYDERQEILNTGAVTLWPEFDTNKLMWFSAHYPGTFSYLAENIKLNSTIQVTTPDMFDSRYPGDTPDILTYKIMERLETDIWAEKEFETTGLRATDMYNDGIDEPMIVIQHSGSKEEEVILYLGKLVDYEKGELVNEKQ